MSPKVCGMVVLLFLTTIAYSQHQTYPHTLLWRITGKGYTHPSYLYGTFHITDKRLFRFGDSVYNAIQKSEGLAIELNPDELMAYIINKAFDQVESKKLSEYLNEKDYKKYKAALEKKFNKPASDITTGDIVREKNKWVNTYLEHGEMSTIMDAWLYNFARRQGKWVGGVEDMADQSGLFDDLIDKSDLNNILAEDSSLNAQSNSHRLLNRMIFIYLEQNLNALDSLMNETETPGEKDAILIKRNVKMARRIDSLTALRTMFIAIGAAHLPGDSGVIHLLQQRGFKVEPVFSSKRISADEYPVKEVHEPWTKVEDEQGFYKVSMPGNPASVKPYGLFDMKCFFNIFNLTSYCTMSVLGAGNLSNKDTIYDDLARRMFNTKEVYSKKVYSNGVEGREYYNLLPGKNMRVQAFIYDKLLYIAFIYSQEKENLASADANKFFSSFIINKNSPVTAGNYTFTDSVMGISFVSPAEITYNKKLSNDEKSWHISGFTGTDIANGSYIMLFSKDIKPTFNLISDTLVFKQTDERVKAQYFNVHTDTINMSGCVAVRFRGQNKEQPEIYMNGISLIKYNRNIMLLVIGDSARLQLPETQKLFTSFHFIEPSAVKWNTRSSADGMVSAWLPDDFRTHNNGKTNYIYAFDTTTASCYYVFHDTLSKYTWFNSDTTFWNDRMPIYTGLYKLEKVSDVTNAQLHGKELLLRKGGSIYKRSRFLLHGNVVYEISVTGSKDLVLNNNANKFFNTLQITAPVKNKNFLTESKAALLIKDLDDKDSSVRKQAFDYLKKAPFEKKDLPLLREALLKQYHSPYFTFPTDLINTRIAAVLNKFNDEATFRHIKETYKFFGEKEPLKNTALAVLANMHTKESYATLAELLNEYQLPDKTVSYQFQSGLKDSLPLTATIFQALQKLAKDTVHTEAMAPITMKLKDSGYIKPEQLAAIQNDYLEAARTLLPRVQKTKNYFYKVGSLVRLIGSFNTTEANQVLIGFLNAEDKYIREVAATLLIKNNYPEPLLTPVLENLAADFSTRMLLYNHLKEQHKTSLFPKQFLTRRWFAEALLYLETDEDDESPEKIDFITEKTATWKGEQYVFYLFRLQYSDSSSHLGIAGGYIPGENDLEPAKILTGAYSEEAFDAAKVNEHFNKYLSALKEN